MSDDQDSCLRNVKWAATGSGEPKQWCDRHDTFRNECETWHTPPASQPTVTLSRETFDRLISKAESLKSDLLALLRAAEGNSR